MLMPSVLPEFRSVEIVVIADQLEAAVAVAEGVASRRHPPASRAGEEAELDPQVAALDGYATLGERIFDGRRDAARDERVVLKRKRIPGGARLAAEGDGEDARVAVERAFAEPVLVRQDVPGVRVAEDEHQIGNAIAVEVARDLLLDPPSCGHEAFRGRRLPRQLRVGDLAE